MTRAMRAELDTAAVVTGTKPRFRVLRIACLCAGLMIAAPPAIAGIEPSPFLNFVLTDPPDGSSIAFEVTLPSSPTIPVEILSLSLVGTAPAISISLSGRDSEQAAFAEFQLAGTQSPDNGIVAFDLLFDVASFMGSDPLFLAPPDDQMPGPLSMFELMFDVVIDGGVVHHVATFTAVSGFMFSDITIGAGSVAIGFDLTGPYTSGGPGLFTVAITGSAEPIPEPSTLALFSMGLVGLGFMRRRRKISRPYVTNHRHSRA